MKKVLSLFLAALFLASLAGCGAKAENKDAAAAENASALIEAIGEVTLKSGEAINAAEEAYAALSDEQKALVENAEQLSLSRSRFEELKREAAQERLESEVLGAWWDVTDSTEAALLIRADGTALVDHFDYTWTMDRAANTVLFEGRNTLVFELSREQELLTLRDPEGKLYLPEGDYLAFAQDVLYQTDDIRSVLGDAVDVGALPEDAADGKDQRLFAFTSSAYRNGLIYLCCSDDFKMTYGSGRIRGELREPFAAAAYSPGDGKPEKLRITEQHGTITFVRAQFIEDLRFDASTNERTIILRNGLVLVTASRKDFPGRDLRFDGFCYLADPRFQF